MTQRNRHASGWQRHHRHHRELVDTDAHVNDGPASDGMVHVARGYLDAGNDRDAYATTIHKAQGLTVDQALVLGDDTLLPRSPATSPSPATDTRTASTSLPEPMSTSITAPRPSEHPWTSLPGALRVSRAQELAIDQRIDTPEIREHLVDLYGQRAHVRGRSTRSA